ncbi:zinc-ribbon and DUF3426 domain-containing protein [Beggiatoa leptomitoformis]|uniref:DUF3426 domain-containing protein n=1 Tax=Beggiatoa leptomitoformis TaxID=288004 RepID=A0A2N9YI73_9GAMM|nr:zinc-ribbon and DUF3426 domain-containing protein [Beggiatoa leptomitoformis]ALG67557.1 DUF3426 domain-containing protein [Beggiatoa leptomitoformis]AUI70217.1 DUF3426 domain-containing protein [Beggiatoa leptomitoformis]
MANLFVMIRFIQWVICFTLALIYPLFESISMYTQCPHCQTIFRLNTAHLNVAQGYVKCVNCQHTFDASKNLMKEIPKDLKNKAITVVPEALTEDDISEEELAEIVQETKKSQLGSVLKWSFVSLLLMGLLALQYVWFMYPDIILQNAQLRPLLSQACEIAGCELPVTRNVDLIHMQERVVQIHPDSPDMLQVNATFVNDATFPQPYPILELTFEDRHGQPIAQRRFTPTEYLGVDIKEKMQAGAIVHVRFDLIDMSYVIEGNSVMEGYHFEFL